MSESSFPTGHHVAHYRIVGKIGTGGMGDVYRATDTKLGRNVALKIMRAEMARDSDRLARFQREARAVAALNHPHIVTIYACARRSLRFLEPKHRRARVDNELRPLYWRRLR